MKRKSDRDLTNLPPPMASVVMGASASFVVVASAILILADELSGGQLSVFCAGFGPLGM